MKRTIVFCLSLVILLTTVLSACSSNKQKVLNKSAEKFSFDKKTSSYSYGLDAMTLCSQKGDYSLYVNETTLSFAVVYKENEKIWYQALNDNPDISTSFSDETSAFYTIETLENGNRKTYNSFTDGVRNGLFDLTVTNDGFTVNSAVGKHHEITSKDLPQAVKKKHFEEKVLNKLNDSDKAAVMDRYTLFSVNDSSISKAKLEAALDKYKSLKNDDLYILNAGIPSYAAEKIKSILDSVGYGVKEIEKDNRDNGVEIKLEENIRYDAQYSVKLEENGISVEFDCSRYDSPSNTVLNVSILPFFEGTVSDENGFILLPDGSGSILDIRGAKSNYPEYAIKLYGENLTIPKNQTFSNIQPAILPIYGMVKNQTGFLSIIEKGDAIASIRHSLKGSDITSAVYPSFEIAENYPVDLGYKDTASGSLVDITAPKTYTDKIKLKYILIPNNCDLGSMSRCAREEMKKSGILGDQSYNEGSTLQLEIIGAIDKKSTFLGVVPTSKSVAATRISSAEKMVDTLSQNGVDSLNLIYNGWCNGGLYTKKLNTVNIEKSIGDPGDLQSLYQRLKSGGNTLTLNASFMKLNNTSGFKISENSARQLGNTASKIYNYDIATGYKYENRVGTLITPGYISKYIDAFKKSVKKLSYSNIRSNDLGAVLYSDMNTNNGTTREDAKEKIIDILSKNDFSITVGNAYAIKNASYINSIPTDSSGYKREEYSVPFAQMVLRGSIGYSSSPINTSGNSKTALLRAVSCGADLSYLVIGNDDSIFYDSYYNTEYSRSFKNQKANIIKAYKKADDTLTNVIGKRITGYIQIEENVFKTDFENGYAIITNFNSNDVLIDNSPIKAFDWILVQ